MLCRIQYQFRLILTNEIRSLHHSDTKTPCRTSYPPNRSAHRVLVQLDARFFDAALATHALAAHSATTHSSASRSDWTAGSGEDHDARGWQPAAHHRPDVQRQEHGAHPPRAALPARQARVSRGQVHVRQPLLGGVRSAYRRPASTGTDLPLGAFHLPGCCRPTTSCSWTRSPCRSSRTCASTWTSST